jgi:thiamine-monophosphate kinase
LIIRSASGTIYPMMKRTQPLTETGLIQKITRSIEAAGVKPGGLVTGVGDDAAVFRGGRGEDFVVTQDVQVEDQHFNRSWFSGRELGWRLAAVNLSDVAAMGAAPRYALFSLVLPPSVESRYTEQIAKGITAHLARFGAALIGGNVSATNGPLSCDLTLIGSCRRDRAWLRRARPGDAIVLAGEVGAAAAGLDILTSGATRAPRGQAGLVRAFKRPEPLLDVSGALRGRTAVHGAIDVSDGLSTDLLRICRICGVGCELFADRLPLCRPLARYCAGTGCDPVDVMLGGGEDYALILSVAPRWATRISGRIRSATGRPAAVVGRFTASTGTWLVGGDGGPMRLQPTGWEHLTSTP